MTVIVHSYIIYVAELRVDCASIQKKEIKNEKNECVFSTIRFHFIFTFKNARQFSTEWHVHNISDLQPHSVTRIRQFLYALFHGRIFIIQKLIRIQTFWISCVLFCILRHMSRYFDQYPVSAKGPTTLNIKEFDGHGHILKLRRDNRYKKKSE